jgi:hypothetical protein
MSGASVTVPPGAVAQPTAIAIAEAVAAMPPLPTVIAKAGPAFALTPHGTTFQVPVAIQIPIDGSLAAQATDPSRIHLYTADPGGNWTVVPGARAVGSHFEAEVSHFSFFVVGFEVIEQTFPAGAGRALDILFMVDKSFSMTPLQAQLIQNFPSFMQTLKNLPDGLPNIHVGVVSSDLGAGRETAVPNCAPSGDGGRLQSAPQRPGCSGPRDAYISASEREATKNYDGTIEDTFACIAALGDQGCGFEHQLESAAVALGYAGSIPAENAGFLRPQAYLAVVFITNEDDCSAPPDAAIFDPSSRLVADPYGPLASYRCNEYGHLCGGNKPPRSQAAMLSDCHSAEDGILIRVSELAAFFKSLKPDPSLIFMSAIAGPVTPYDVRMTPSQGAGGVFEDQPGIGHSCSTASGAFADPPIRLAEFIAKFGDNGTMENICADSFAPALTRIAAALGRKMGPLCLQAAVIDAAASPARLAPGCTVVERVPAGGGTTTETALRRCDPVMGPPPCWDLAANAQCPGSLELVINRTGAAPAGAVVAVRCP